MTILLKLHLQLHATPTALSGDSAVYNVCTQYSCVLYDILFVIYRPSFQRNQTKRVFEMRNDGVGKGGNGTG